jgi:hypothetical protein
MKSKVFLGLSVLVVIGLLFGCSNGTTETPQGSYGGAGVWLITSTNWDDYKTATNDFQNLGDYQPTPTALAYIESISDTFNANFKEPTNHNPNKATSTDGWWSFYFNSSNISVSSGSYYVVIVPMWLPTNNWDDGFNWVFDEALIYVGSSGNSPATKNVNGNSAVPFTLTDFKDAYEVSF